MTNCPLKDEDKHYYCTVRDEPSHYGLEVIDSFDFSSGSYEFDERVIWRVTGTLNLLTARDSGCSCPRPFEDFEVKDLDTVNFRELIDEAKNEMKDEGYRYGASIHDITEWIATLNKLWEEYK